MAAAEAGIRSAVGELRDLAHGLFPAVLANERLRAALDRNPVRITAERSQCSPSSGMARSPIAAL
jgi:hypothetical protein